MRQRFFTSTVQGRLIKNILKNTPIPIYDTVRPGDYIIKNCKYVYNISLIQCTKSGTLEGTGEFIRLDYTFYWGTSKVNYTHSFTSNTSFYDSETHEWLGNYLRAYRDMKGINLMPFYNCFSGVYTNRFKLLPVEYYTDIRSLKDTIWQLENDVAADVFLSNYSLDYIIESNIITITGGNDCSNEELITWFSNNATLDQSTSLIKKLTYTYIGVYQSNFSYDTYTQGSQEFNNAYVEKSPYKIFSIPVKLNRTYTIALDCDANIRIAPAFINHGKLVEVSAGTSKISLTELLITNIDTSGKYNPISTELTNSSFIKPFTFTIENKNQKAIEGVMVSEDAGLTNEQLLQRYEQYLYLLIQVPRDNNSGLVVLEGDYTEAAVDKVYSNEYMELKEYTPSHIYTSSSTVLDSTLNPNTTTGESKCPYVSYVNIDEISFNNKELTSSILNINILDESEQSIIDNFGYMEYYFRPGTELIRIPGDVQPVPLPVNLYIYSYVPVYQGASVEVQYADNYTSKTVTAPDNRNSDEFLDKELLSKLSLLQFDDGRNYPFSSVLIEYLLLNVIDSEDEIGANIKLAQRLFNVTSGVPGAWSNNLRRKIFIAGKSPYISHFDNVGYVDKIRESLIR